MGLSPESRLLRLVRQQDRAIAELATQHPASRTAEYLRDRIARLDTIMQTIRLDAAKARLSQTGAPPTGVAVTPSIRFAPGRVPEIGFGGIEMPVTAEAFKLPREQDIELVTVWTPHRDAPSLIGNYELRPRC